MTVMSFACCRIARTDRWQIWRMCTWMKLSNRPRIIRSANQKLASYFYRTVQQFLLVCTNTSLNFARVGLWGGYGLFQKLEEIRGTPLKEDKYIFSPKCSYSQAWSLSLKKMGILQFVQKKLEFPFPPSKMVYKIREVPPPLKKASIFLVQNVVIPRLEVCL